MDKRLVRIFPVRSAALLMLAVLSAGGATTQVGGGGQATQAARGALTAAAPRMRPRTFVPRHG